MEVLITTYFPNGFSYYKLSDAVAPIRMRARNNVLQFAKHLFCDEQLGSCHSSDPTSDEYFTTSDQAAIITILQNLVSDQTPYMWLCVSSLSGIDLLAITGAISVDEYGTNKLFLFNTIINPVTVQTAINNYRAPNVLPNTAIYPFCNISTEKNMYVKTPYYFTPGDMYISDLFNYNNGLYWNGPNALIEITFILNFSSNRSTTYNFNININNSDIGTYYFTTSGSKYDITTYRKFTSVNTGDKMRVYIDGNYSVSIYAFSWTSKILVYL